jgi:alpha-L-arabinofuranosidase
MNTGAETLNISINPQDDGARISPLLFGHNIEHTRSCMWRGLSAQLIRNRKFAGKPQQLVGLAMQWYPIGPPQTYYLLDAKNAYTRHYTDEKRQENEMHSQYIQGCATGERCGIGQDGLSLEAKREYTLRLATKSAYVLPVRIDILNTDRGTTLSSFDADLSPADWHVSEYTFQVDTTDPAARLEITFEGPADLHVGFVSLLPSDSFHGMRRDVVDLLEEIGAPILRWPGGNFAGDYRWQDGLLDTDVRAPLNTHLEVEMLPHTFGFDFHEIGTDEFVELCRKLGAEPFISINLGWDTPEVCAAWVEYCNGAKNTEWGNRRAERGNDRPFNVKYWSLGNELGHGHMMGPNDAAAYAVKAAECAQAMRNVDPSIVLVMSGDWREEEWFTDGLPPLAEHIDCIAWHQYDEALLSYLEPNADREFERLMREPDLTQEKLKVIREKMNKAIAGDKFIGISYDEWNVWFAWYRTPGVAEGVHAAKMLNLFSRNTASAGIQIGCFFEPINEGAIAVDSFTSRLTPTGQVFSLFKAHHGNTLVETNCPTTDECVDWVASMNKEEKAIVVTVANGSPKNGTEIQFRVGGNGTVSVSEGVLLSSEDFMPASIFDVQSLPAENNDNGAICVRLPKHSVARLTINLHG